ncbi:MAG: hypothetical protein SGILL_006709 [Bacillariaceae sp.]
MRRPSHTDDMDQNALINTHTAEREVIHDVQSNFQDDTQNGVPSTTASNAFGVTSSKMESMEYEYNFEQQQQQQHEHPQHHPTILRYLPRLVRYDNNDLVEASGCAVDMYARSTVFMAGIFLGPALLELASMQATNECLQQQEQNDDASLNCDDTDNLTVYGFKPSSLLTNMVIIVNFVATLLLPIAGVIVDYTPYRRHVGMYTAAIMTCIKFMELGLGQSTWFFVAWLQIITGIVYQLHTASSYAYSSELSKEPTEQSAFQSHFFMVMYISMLLYMLEILIPGQVWQMDDVATARLAVLVTCLTTTPLFFISWRYLFRDKPPVSRIPPGETLLSAGFLKLYRTYNDLSTDYRSVKIFLAGIACSEAADTALATIATTFMKEYLGMNSLEIGLVLLVVLIAGMPGTYVGNVLCKRYNPVVSAKTCLVQYIVVTIAASLFLRPNTKNLAYLFGFLWGMCQGWMHPQHTTIFVTISPKDKGEVELMGLFLFAASIFGFIPPLVFSVFNEMGLPMWVGVSTLVFYFILGYIGLVAMGDYEAARAQSHGPALIPQDEDEEGVLT